MQKQISICPLKGHLILKEAEEFTRLMQDWRHGLYGDVSTANFMALVAYIDDFGDKRYLQGLADAKCTDPIVEQNVSLLRERSVVGVQKYGTTLVDNKLTHGQWMRHLLEELLDGANYIQAALVASGMRLDRIEMDDDSWLENANGDWIFKRKSGFERYLNEFEAAFVNAALKANHGKA